MKISIITVCYNSAEFIRTAIESVLSQSYSNIEYIVIDGGSSDDTVSIIHEYENSIAYFISEDDQGIYDAMNKGVALASGEVIGILNSDDFYPHREVLSEIVTTFEKYQDVDMVLGNVDYVSAKDLTKSVRCYSSFKFSPWKMRFGFMPAHPAAFIKKTAYDQVGQYKLGYKIGADFDMFVRMLWVYKLPFSKINKSCVRMRIGGVSNSSFKSYWVITSEILRSLKENKIYSNIFLVSMRLPIKFFQLVFARFRAK